MAFAINFTEATIGKAGLVLGGASEAPVIDLLEIRVILQLEDGTIERAFADKPGEAWTAPFPGSAAKEGQQIFCFGTETRQNPLRVTTWAEMLTITAAPDEQPPVP